MNSKIKILLLLPFLMLSSCNNVSSHDDFALKGISYLKNSRNKGHYSVIITGTYDKLETNAHYDLCFEMFHTGAALYYLDKNCPEYLELLVNYIEGNCFLRDYIIYTTNSNMKKYYVNNDTLKVEDYSIFGNSSYTDHYIWNSDALLTEMKHYFKDENSDKPIAIADITIAKKD